jgi:hypothetical protein
VNVRLRVSWGQRMLLGFGTAATRATMPASDRSTHSSKDSKTP